ncbi:MAG: hypothetical protein P8X42_13535 [Calditrichaceae bacterium]
MRQLTVWLKGISEDKFAAFAEELNGCGRRSIYRPAGAYCYGDEKLNKIIEYCKSNHFDLGKAYYYADSYSDLNVLKAVGNPVCVSPDRKLKKIAQKEGWRISIW